MRILACLCALLAFLPATAQSVHERSKVWVADIGDGTYKKPVIYADYSDPDAIRVNDDYYLVASSFDAIPGLPILHSKDLVNWRIVAHALLRQPPYDHFSATQHGNGAWAPAIRYHQQQFYNISMLVMGADYAGIRLEKRADGLYLTRFAWKRMPNAVLVIVPMNKPSMMKEECLLEYRGDGSAQR